MDELTTDSWTAAAISEIGGASLNLSGFTCVAGASELYCFGERTIVCAANAAPAGQNNSIGATGALEDCTLDVKSGRRKQRQS